MQEPDMFADYNKDTEVADDNAYVEMTEATESYSGERFDAAFERLVELMIEGNREVYPDFDRGDAFVGIVKKCSIEMEKYTGDVNTGILPAGVMTPDEMVEALVGMDDDEAALYMHNQIHLLLGIPPLMPGEVCEHDPNNIGINEAVDYLQSLSQPGGSLTDRFHALMGTVDQSPEAIQPGFEMIKSGDPDEPGIRQAMVKAFDMLGVSVVNEGPGYVVVNMSDLLKSRLDSLGLDMYPENNAEKEG